MSASIFDWLNLMAQNIWLYGGSFALVLGVLVFVHEWGHYIVARLCGVKIESFSIGFGPELFGFTDKKGTRWKFSLIPLGGYVKMFGDVDPASAGHSETVEDKETQQARPLTGDERRVAFFSQSVGRRAAIVFAGPAINYIFAIFILASLFIFYGQPVTPPVAAAVVGGSAAESAGFQPHDEIVEIDGKTIRRFEDIRREVMVGLDEERLFKIVRDGKTIEIKAAAERIKEEDRFGFSQSRGLLGLISQGNAIDIKYIKAIDGKDVESPEQARELITSKLGTTFSITLDRGSDKTDTLIINPLASLNEDINNEEGENFNYLVLARSVDEYVVKHGVVDGVVQAVRETASITVNTLEALWQMITGTRSATELGGIIRIGAIAGDMAKSGMIALVTFTALLSINLGLINLFPIPMLDGGHLFFYMIEFVKGSPISEQIQEYAFRLGLAILVGIMVFANLNDIIQLVL